MRRFALVLFLLFGSLLAVAKVYKPADIKPVHLEDRNRYVCNPDGILSQEAVDRIDAAFRTIEDSTGIQTLVAVVTDIDPDDCFEFAHQLGEKVGVGRSSSDNGLVILLTTVGNVTQVIAGLATQLLVLCALGKVGEDALGLFHGVLVVILLRGHTALTHERGGQVELGLLAGGIGLQGLAVLDLGLGIAFFLIEFVAVAQAHPFLLGHFGCLVLGHRGCGCTQRQNNRQRSDGEFIFYLVESHC